MYKQGPVTSIPEIYKPAYPLLELQIAEIN